MNKNNGMSRLWSTRSFKCFPVNYSSTTLLSKSTVLTITTTDKLIACHLYQSMALITHYTLSEAWSGVNWADLMAAQGAFETDFYDRSTRTIVGKARCFGRSINRPVIKIGPKGTLDSHEIRPIHSAPSLGQSIAFCITHTNKKVISFRKKKLNHTL